MISTASAGNLRAALTTLACLATASAVSAAEPLSLSQQTALVHKYCAVCHTDSSRNGGLSLEHYDAARSDPALAAMLLSKLRNGAMGAAGMGIPEKSIGDAWTAATADQAAGAEQWTVTRTAETIAASIVRDVPPRKPGTDHPVYRLLLTCEPSRGRGEMQLTWSPEPQTDRMFSVMVDDQQAIPHGVEGKENMGNGSSGTSGRAGTVLKAPLPRTALVIKDLFPGETVAFPVRDLNPDVRQQLGACFPPHTAAAR